MSEKNIDKKYLTDNSFLYPKGFAKELMADEWTKEIIGNHISKIPEYLRLSQKKKEDKWEIIKQASNSFWQVIG